MSTDPKSRVVRCDGCGEPAYWTVEPQSSGHVYGPWWRRDACDACLGKLARASGGKTRDFRGIVVEPLLTNKGISSSYNSRPCASTASTMRPRRSPPARARSRG
jgi:hypothetical protein